MHLKEVTENLVTITPQTETIKRTKMQILELENTISKGKMYQMDSTVNLRWQKKELNATKGSTVVN